jgi:malonyl-CoA O-methyltransferase
MSAAQLPLVFMHGWGFDATVWDGMREQLAESPAVMLEAGYFGREIVMPGEGVELPAAYVAVGHSLGAMRWLALHDPRCRGLVLVNGFPRFAASADFPEGVAPRLIDRMLARLAVDPAAVVGDFRKRCGAEDEPEGGPVSKLLEDGLRQLRDGDERSALAHIGVPVLVLAGDMDAIVPPALTTAAFADAAQAQVRWCEGGGHLLPLTHASWCAEYVREFAAGLADAASARAPGIAERFGAAASRYARHADLQREVARQLAERIAMLPLPKAPRILEVGCGTGFLAAELAQRLGPAHWTLTDIAPRMLDAARSNLVLPGEAEFRVMDGEHPDVRGSYDLICSSMAVQWFGDLDAGLARLAGLLAPGGHLAVATLAEETFAEWHAAHAVHGLAAAAQRYPSAAEIGACLPGLVRRLDVELRKEQPGSGMAFLRGLRAIGATAATVEHRQPLPAGALRRVLQTFDAQGASVSYQVAYGVWSKPGAIRGVFVTGTDTGIGKTLVSSVLVRAWQADYWKPLQTGVSEEPGDTETVSALADLPASRRHAPHAVLQAPLSPWAAAMAEGAAIDMAAIALPATDAPLVVEGAGGLLVPINDEFHMIDLAAQLALPVVLVARSGLGTINHTLLSLEALYSRGLPVAGVIMSGPSSPGNRHAIEHFGKVRVLAEIPALEKVDAAAVAELARTIPPLAEILSGVMQ